MVGDRIYVTGELGASALGLLLFERGFRLNGKSQRDIGETEDEMRRAVLLKHVAPEPRLKLGRAIGESGVATAMIDISDGLSTDLWHILDESGCGAVIRAEAIPIAGSVISLLPSGSGTNPLRLALNGGEEYELLFTARPEDKDRVAELSYATGTPIREIGEIVAGNGLKLEQNETIEPLPPSGYEHNIKRQKAIRS